MYPAALHRRLFGIPLTSRELLKGRAMRLVAKLRSSSPMDEPAKSFHDVIFVAERDTCKNFLSDISLFDYCGLFRLSNKSVFAGTSVVYVSQAGYMCPNPPKEESYEVWKLHEFHIEVPTYLKMYRIKYDDDLIELVGIKKQRKLKAEYGLDIQNASTNKKYENWLAAQRRSRMNLPLPKNLIKFSICVPLYHTPIVYLNEMLDSVINQTYGNWELVLVNASPDDIKLNMALAEVKDKRVKIYSLEHNLGIAGNTNYGIEKCSGDYVCFLDHDDILELHALAEYVRVIESSKVTPNLLYCDEDNLDEEGHYVLPLFKPEFNYSHLLTTNYVLHFLAVKRNVLTQIEQSSSSVNGAQDYDLTLKITEKDHALIRHVPFVLYHWRIHNLSTAKSSGVKEYAQQAGREAIKLHIERTGLKCSVQLGGHPFEYSIYSLRENYKIQVIVIDEIKTSLLDSLNEAADLVLIVSSKIKYSPSDIKNLSRCFYSEQVFSVYPKVISKEGIIIETFAIVRNENISKLGTFLPCSDGGYVGRFMRRADTAVINPDCCMFDMHLLKRYLKVAKTQGAKEQLLLSAIMANIDGFQNIFCGDMSFNSNSTFRFFEEMKSEIPYSYNNYVKKISDISSISNYLDIPYMQLITDDNPAIEICE